jgi:hypothetical protein
MGRSGPYDREGRPRTIRTLAHAQFWGVVAGMGHELIPARLFATLSALSWSERQAFCDQLRRVEEALCTTPHERAAVTAWERVRDGRLDPSAPDERLPAEPGDVRMTVIAHGYDAWAAVVAVPTLLGGVWPTELGRAFACTVAQACGYKAVGASSTGDAPPRTTSSRTRVV